MSSYTNILLQIRLKNSLNAIYGMSSNENTSKKSLGLKRGGFLLSWDTTEKIPTILLSNTTELPLSESPRTLNRIFSKNYESKKKSSRIRKSL